MKYTLFTALAAITMLVNAAATAVFVPIDITTATGSTASQSSTLGAQYAADAALNGNTGDFTHTNAPDPSPSWSGNLNRNETFDQVIIHNRDDCCQGRLSVITLQVLDSSNAVLYTSGY